MPEQPQLEIGIETRPVDGAEVAFVTPTGDIDLSTADELAGAMASPACQRAEKVVLDLRAVPFMDSSGFRVVMIAVRDNEPNFAAVITPYSSVAKLLELVDAGGRIQVAADKDEALRKLGVGGTDAGG